MHHPITRVLTVLELLQSHSKLSGPELAERLEVNPRTVRNYITLLQDLGVPVEAERGRHGAYRLRPGFKLPPLMFTEDEAVALTLGLLTARWLGLGGSGVTTEGALAKVERVLPVTLKERVQALQDSLVFDLTSPYEAPASPLVTRLSLATQGRRRVQLCHRARGGEETQRALDPYGVVYYQGRWFAVGHCHLRGELRSFRLDRVLGVELTDVIFERPTNIDCLAHVVEALATTPGTWGVEVLLRTTLVEAQRFIPAAMATLTAESNGVVLRCNVQRLDWLAHMLAGLRMPLVVRQPPELRESLRQLAKHTALLAESEEGDGLNA